jgi:hypothetical protein
MFDHMHGVMRDFAKKMIQWTEDFYCAVKVARQTLSKYYAKVTPMTCLLRSSAHILHPFLMMRLYSEWDTAMEINPNQQMSYISPFQQAFRKYVGNEYCAKQR